MTSIESKGKGKKRDSSSIGEAPNYIIEYDRLDLSKKCPRISKLFSSTDENAGLEDLDMFQIELETMLTDSMKRLRLLKNEFNSTDLQILKSNKNFDDRFKRLKDSNNEKCNFDKVTLKNKTKLPSNCDMIANILKYKTSSTNINDFPCQFWNCIKNSYDANLNISDLNSLMDFLNYNVCTNYNQDLSIREKSKFENKNKGEQKHYPKEEVINCIKENLEEPSNPESNKGVVFGQYTQRLVSSLITNKSSTKGDGHDNFLHIKEFLNNNSLSQLDANSIEKNIYKDLRSFNFISHQDPSECKCNGEELAHYLTRFKEMHMQINQCNRHNLQSLTALGISEISKQKLYKKAKEVHLEIIDAYKNLLISKQKRGSLTESEREYFNRIISKKDRLVSYINSL